MAMLPMMPAIVWLIMEKMAVIRLAAMDRTMSRQ